MFPPQCLPWQLAGQAPAGSPAFQAVHMRQSVLPTAAQRHPHEPVRAQCAAGTGARLREAAYYQLPLTQVLLQAEPQQIQAV